MGWLAANSQGAVCRFELDSGCDSANVAAGPVPVVMSRQPCKAGGLAVDGPTAMPDVDCQWRSLPCLLMQFNSRIGEWRALHWISGSHSEPSWEAQVKTEHPHQGERDEPQAEE